MDALQSSYANLSPDSSPVRLSLPARSSAPTVDDNADPLHTVLSNPSSDHMWSPISGAAHRNHQLGFVEDVSVESFAFDQQYYSGDLKTGGRRVYKDAPQKKRAGELTEEHAKKKKKEGETDAGFGDKTVFHGEEERDYQGRSWTTPPSDKKTKPRNDQCYVPKRWIHTWEGHEKGVSAIRFLPNYGHLLLCAGMDSKVKIWDVHNSRQCMRTYMGHSEAVKDICFSNNGSRFLSGSYDKNIKFWDTETGKVISTFSTGKIPYVVKLNPDEDKQNVAMAGMSDKKIVQWDVNSGKMTQVYDQHLGAVNSITFVDDNRRFITSSDDKSLRVWDFGIPVVIKNISETGMHSIPTMAVHPDSNWAAGQSMDNQIVVYGTRQRFQKSSKRFAGHVSAGYACQVKFSPDGRFLVSGDGEGNCWFWDWKTCKVSRKLRKCHKGVCIGVE